MTQEKNERATGELEQIQNALGKFDVDGKQTLLDLIAFRGRPLTPLLIASGQGNLKEVERILFQRNKILNVNLAEPVDQKFLRTLDYGFLKQQNFTYTEPIILSNAPRVHTVQNIRIQPIPVITVTIQEYMTPLIAAVEIGHCQIVRLLIEFGGDPNAAKLERRFWYYLTRDLRPYKTLAIEDSKKFAISIARANLHADMMKILLGAGATLSTDKNATTETTSEHFLCFACTKGDPELVKMLLKSGANSSVGLNVSCTIGDYGLAKLLLQTGATITPQSTASSCRSGNRDLVKLLLDAGATPSDGLEAACTKGDIEVVKLLLDAGAETTSEESLTSACRIGSYELVKLLLDAGASTLLFSGAKEISEQCMILACRSGNRKLVKLLLCHCASASDGLEEACSQGDAELVEMLLNAGAAPTLGITISCIHGDYALVKLLLDAGAKQSPQAFIAACQSSNHELIKLLLDTGALPSDGLEQACLKGDQELVKMLLDAGASPSRGLEAACSKGNQELVRMLLVAGAKSTKKLLDLACRGNHWGTAALLVEPGVDAYSAYMSSEGMRQRLFKATERADLTSVRGLLELGVPVTNPVTWTPLIFVAVRNPQHSIDVVRELIRFKVDVNVKDKGGKTALDWIQSLKGREATERLLISVGAKSGKDL